MKYITIYILLVISSIGFSCNNKLYDSCFDNNCDIEHCPFSEYKGKQKPYFIEKIKEQKGIYIITAYSEDKNYFTIISPRIKKTKCLKIKEQECYLLRLYSYFEIDENAVYTWSHIKMKFDVQGKNVTIKETYKTGYVVTTPDLHGLYYCPTQNE